MEEYELNNGLVFRIGIRGEKLLHVPEELEESAIPLIHEKYSNVGIEKCMAQIKKYYWFPIYII